MVFNVFVSVRFEANAASAYVRKLADVMKHDGFVLSQCGVVNSNSGDILNDSENDSENGIINKSGCSKNFSTEKFLAMFNRL